MVRAPLRQPPGFHAGLRWVLVVMRRESDPATMLALVMLYAAALVAIVGAVVIL